MNETRNAVRCFQRTAFENLVEDRVGGLVVADDLTVATVTQTLVGAVVDVL
jgi:hypothetical protein